MWKPVESVEIIGDASFDIWVSKGPMEGLQRECGLFKGYWYNGEDLVAPAAWISHVRPVSKPIGPHDRIAGKTIAEWQDLARRDDCFDMMVPSDLRIILQFIA